MILLEANLNGLVTLIFSIWFGPPVTCAIIGGFFWIKEKRNTAKKFLIAGAVYLLIGLGICGMLIAGG